jgi:hypothetical protein
MALEAVLVVAAGVRIRHWPARLASRGPQRADWSAELQLERPDGGRVAGQASCSAISIEASMGNLLIEGQPK